MLEEKAWKGRFKKEMDKEEEERKKEMFRAKGW